MTQTLGRHVRAALLLAVFLPLAPGDAKSMECGSINLISFCLINNGLTPPNPENVIDTGNDFVDTRLFVRNVACGSVAEPDQQPCANPGVPTTVEVAGGFVRELKVYDTSIVNLVGGALLGTGGVGLNTLDSASVAIAGGNVAGLVRAQDASSIEVTAGAFFGDGSNPPAFEAYNDATITVFGTDFKVNGVPVSYGPLPTKSGTLTGILTSGEVIEVSFRHDGYSSGLSGHVVVPEPVTGLLDLSAAVALVAISRIWSMRTVAGRAVQQANGAAAPPA